MVMAAVNPGPLATSNSGTEQTTVQSGAQLGTSHARVLLVEKTVKYCVHCKKDYHTIDECHLKHPNLATKPRDGTKSTSKRRRGNPPVKTETDSQAAQYYAESDLVMFMATKRKSLHQASASPTHWIWDCGASQHGTPHRSLFSTFRKLSNQHAIQGVTGKVIPPGVGTVQLLCTSNSGPEILFLHNVLYIPGAVANFISPGQMQRERYPLSIIQEGIKVTHTGILAGLIANNLYIIDTLDLDTTSADLSSISLAALSAINKDTVRMWHEQLGHLGTQNIHRLINMSEGIDLTKSPPKDACPPCSIATIQVEPLTAYTESGLDELDLIHGDVQGPFALGIGGARYFASWLDDKTKRSEVAILKRKSEVLDSFKNYLLRNEHGENRCRRLRSDGGGEYDSQAWYDFRSEHGIKWESIVPGNPQQNGKAERLGQTIHKTASSILKDSGLDIRFWPEMVCTSSYLRNRQPVTGRDVTSYEASTHRKPQLGHLRRIGQHGYTQVRKPYTGWKKFQDRAIKCMLVGYEGDHIYRMLTPKGKIMRFSNVAWIEHLTSLNHIPLEPANKRHEVSLKDTISLPSTTGEIDSDRILSGETSTSISTLLELAGNSRPSTQLLKSPTKPKITPFRLQSIPYSSRNSPFETAPSSP